MFTGVSSGGITSLGGSVFLGLPLLGCFSVDGLFFLVSLPLRLEISALSFLIC